MARYREGVILGEPLGMCFAFSYTLRLAQFFTPRVDSCLDLDFR